MNDSVVNVSTPRMWYATFMNNQNTCGFVTFDLFETDIRKIP